MGVEGTLPMALRSVVGEDFVKKDDLKKAHFGFLRNQSKLLSVLPMF